MKIVDTITLTEKQKEAILVLWNQEYPVKLKLYGMPDLERYLTGLHDQHHFLLTNKTGKISGWAFTFVREGEKWFAIILDGIVHGMGYGKLLLNALKTREPILNGWVIDHGHDKKQTGEYYRSPLNFYLKNGFVVSTGARLEIDKISAAKIVWTKAE